MLPLRLRYAAITLAAGLLFAACGESPQERFVSDADAVCERVNRDFSERIEGPDALAEIYPVARQAQADLTSLEPPPEKARQFASYLKVNQQRIDLLSAALEDPVSNLQSDPNMKRAEALQAQSGELARALGLEHCS